MHTSYVIINHLKDIKKEKQQLENDEELLMNRVIEEHEGQGTTDDHPSPAIDLRTGPNGSVRRSLIKI